MVSLWLLRPCNWLHRRNDLHVQHLHVLLENIRDYVISIGFVSKRYSKDDIHLLHKK